MKITLRRFVAAVAALGALSATSYVARAEETIKIGIVGPFSGPFATTGTGFRQGLDAYIAQHGTVVGGRKVQLIYRDSETGSSDPSVAKRLAQELVVSDNVALLGGLTGTPSAPPSSRLGPMAKPKAKSPSSSS